MKKFISVFLIIILSLTPLTAFATTPVYDASWAKMGDVNYDQKVNAIDARAVLRYSASLDTKEIDIYRADADGSGKINSADARIILRVSAGLTSFTCGFDGTRTPCVVNTLRKGTYYIEASYDDAGTKENDIMTVKLARSGNDIYFSSNSLGDMDFSGSLGSSSSKYNECGVMMLKNTLYAFFGNSENLFAIPIPPENSDIIGIDADSFIEMADIVKAFIPEDIGIPEKEVINGKDYFVYSYYINNSQYFLYVDSVGRITHIDGTNAKNERITLVTFNKVSGDNPSSYFNLDKYSIINIF